MSEHRDIVIAGGGMVGMSLALKLAAELPRELTITLVEGVSVPAVAGERDYHPSFDARSTALSYSSRLIYEQMGLWQSLEPWLCPIATIHVSNRGRFGSAVLRHQDYAWPALGYVVENAWLGKVLLGALRAQNRIEIISPARVVNASARPSGFELTLAESGGDTTLRSDLLVVADGAGSGLRRALGVTAASKSYDQSALVANVAFAEPHRGCAFERFTRVGPLAVLPLVATAKGEHRGALVWTLPPAQAEELQRADDAEFLTVLQQRFGYRLGRFLQVGETHCYPLALLESAEQVRQGVVVMGNAAHALHPVAGQGFNLALRDIEALSRVLREALERGAAPGELAVLMEYQRRQRVDQQRTIQLSDLLPTLFMQRDPVLGLTRDLALSGLDMVTPLKRQFVRQAAGLVAHQAAGDG